MPPTDTESQFRFLISCIRHSSAGKVNFVEVANECAIISKGAAAKRYERLMKAHGIQPGGAPGSVKKETGDSKDTKDLKDAKEPRGKGRAAAKKRKLAEVDDQADDVDEPVKTEVKGEVKSEVKLEDAMTVKSERPNDDAAPPNCPPSSQSPTVSAPLANGPTDNGDDDDEVFVVSATEKRGGAGDVPEAAYHHHSHPHPHPHSHSHPLAPGGIHSFDYAANMGFPPQQQQQHEPGRMQSMPTSSPTAPAPAMIPSSAFPYGFAPGPWMYPHDAHGYL
ncbi:hypothetical protein F5X99DRAFT_415527 [Biscogniauxia marginata]|nr:hypothetical protein F5X99DRAFT_415527 [Biscogniauxia marginata]